MKSNPGDELRHAAFCALHELCTRLEAHSEIIASMTVAELRDQMTEMGLDPDRPIPYLPGRPSDTRIDGRLRRGADNVVFDTVEGVSPESGAALSSRKLKTRLLIAREEDGTCTYESVDGLLRNQIVARRLRHICSQFNFRAFKGAYDTEDLCQDVWLRVWRHREKLVEPGNILEPGDAMNQTGFYGWLYVIARNQYFNKIRELKTKDRLLTDEQIETLAVPASSGYDEKRYLLESFREFIKGYPKSRQRTIELWLQGYSYREIAELLSNEEVPCSHVTIGKWIMSAVDAFKRTIQAFDSEPARSEALSARLLQRRDT
jgi:RNA polymerase sigma factor (sigma-70 family)